MISIIMPAYNAALYIKEAITTVLNQTYQDWELIIIDDHSTDETTQLIEHFSEMDSRILYIINKTNLGVAAARNKGISIATGEWIAFLDSDDCWHPEKLKKQIDFAESHQGGFIFSGSSFMDESSTPLDYYLTVPEAITYKELLKQNIISCSSVLIRKTLLKNYPMEHASKMHEDFAVWLQILRYETDFAYGINEPLLIYRISSTSKSGNKIKAGLMTFRVYRYLGIHFVPAFYYWICYFIRSVKKYSRLL